MYQHNLIIVPQVLKLLHHFLSNTLFVHNLKLLIFHCIHWVMDHMFLIVQQLIHVLFSLTETGDYVNDQKVLNLLTSATTMWKNGLLVHPCLRSLIESLTPAL